ncbi:MAG: hypothetical protein DRI90_01150 [Deltaproteobacteria bacterium]|nr:MAG: hypothetical protein DRI90_01150 [Deltaproteobacteria bacterium]
MAEDRNIAAELHPSRVIGAFGQPLLAGRRVAVLGDCTTGLPEAVAKASGRRVHAYDPDRERAAASLARSRGRRGARVSTALLDDSLDARDGVFDAVLIADLAELQDIDEPVRLAHSLLSPRGLLLLASKNPDSLPPEASEQQTAIGYYDLYDRLSAVFDHVRMLGQAPFVGYTVAEFAAEGDPGVTIDTSLASRSEEPTHFVVVASDREVELDPYILLQVPADTGRSWLWPAARPERDEEAAATLAQAQRERSALSTELDGLRTRHSDSERLAQERREVATTLSARVAELEAGLADQSRQLQAQVQRHAAQAEEAIRRTQASEAQRRRDRDEFEQTQLAADETHQLDLDQMLERIAELEGDVEGAAEEAAAQEAAAQAAAAQAAAAQEAAAQAAAAQEAAAQAAASPSNETLSEGSVRGYEFQISELKAAVAQARNECDAARAEAARATTLEAELAASKRRQDQAVAQAKQRPVEPADPELDQRHSDEIDELESHLKERGAMVTRLRAELRESTRIGRELVRDLETAVAATGSSDAPVATDDGNDDITTTTATSDLKSAPPAAQLETLIEKCCRYEADAQAASWTIAALNAKLDERQEQNSDHEKLEEALRAAQEQMADLRRQIATDSEQ